MRWGFSSFVAIIAGAVAAQPERPDTVVKAAIVAAGGAEKLARYPAGHVAGKGTMAFAGQETALTFEQSYHIPGRFRTVVQCEIRGEKWELVQVVDGALAKETINGRAVALNDAGIRELQLAVVFNEIAQLSPLLLDKRFVSKPDKTQKAPEMAGIAVHVKGYPEL
ncbi:MAG TPA: hypothetical protein VLM40_21075, partial [Gemmata sp.]|nr:hypothetical protein [Gemmata sp.]